MVLGARLFGRLKGHMGITFKIGVMGQEAKRTTISLRWKLTCSIAAMPNFSIQRPAAHSSIFSSAKYTTVTFIETKTPMLFIFRY